MSVWCRVAVSEFSVEEGEQRLVSSSTWLAVYVLMANRLLVSSTTCIGLWGFSGSAKVEVVVELFSIAV